MPRNILISGADSLLGKHLVSHYLASSDDIIHCFRAGTLIAEELTSSMSQIVAEIITAPSTSALQAQLNSRLLIIPANVNCAPDLADILRTVLPVPEVWFLPPARYSDRRPDDADCASMLSSLLAVLPVIGAKTFNYV